MGARWSTGPYAGDNRGTIPRARAFALDGDDDGLTCDYLGDSSQPGSFSVFTTPDGTTYTSFGSTFTLAFEASGGTGTYTWSGQQTLTRSYSFTLTNGQVKHGTIPITEQVAFAVPTGYAYQATGAYAQTYDRPGIIVSVTPDGQVKVGASFWTFVTQVFVSDGQETVACPEIGWQSFDYVFPIGAPRQGIVANNGVGASWFWGIV